MHGTQFTEEFYRLADEVKKARAACIDLPAEAPIEDKIKLCRDWISTVHENEALFQDHLDIKGEYELPYKRTQLRSHALKVHREVNQQESLLPFPILKNDPMLDILELQLWVDDMYKLICLGDKGKGKPESTKVHINSGDVTLLWSEHKEQILSEIGVKITKGQSKSEAVRTVINRHSKLDMEDFHRIRQAYNRKTAKKKRK